LGRGNHAIDGTAFVDSDVRIAQRSGNIAHMHHIRMAEIDDGIAVGMCGFRVIDENLFIIEVQRHAVRKSQHRQGRGRGRVALRRRHAFAHVVV